MVPAATATAEPLIRRGTPADAEACHEVMWASVTDLGMRHGTPLHGSVAEWWASAEPLQRFLATHANEWWVAEEPDRGALIGYGRSIERGGLLELTEFFVLPTHQSAGVGSALLDRAFPPDRGDIRSIIATTDVRALSRYYRVGTVARFPIFTLEGEPAKTQIAGDLAADRVDIDSDVDRLWDSAVLGRLPLSTPTTCRPSCCKSKSWLSPPMSSASTSRCPRPMRSLPVTC